MPFVGLFFLVALALSFVELVLLVKVAGAFGPMTAVALCLLTAVIGGTIARRQGRITLERMNAEAMAGRVPATEILEGVMLVVAGVMLLVPGFVTDALGFSLLVPGVRRSGAHALKRHFASRIQVRTFGGFPGGFDPTAGQPRAGDPDVIDVEVEVHDRDDRDRLPG